MIILKAICIRLEISVAIARNVSFQNLELKILVWIVGIAVALFFLFAFPKQSLFLIGGLVILIAALVQNGNQQSKERELRKEAIKFTIKYSETDCGKEFPLFVVIKNESDFILNSINFTITGMRSGYSNPVYENSISYSSDKILKPLEINGSCWRVPELNYGATAGPPQTMEWYAKIAYADFEPK